MRHIDLQFIFCCRYQYPTFSIASPSSRMLLHNLCGSLSVACWIHFLRVPHSHARTAASRLSVTAELHFRIGFSSRHPAGDNYWGPDQVMPMRDQKSDWSYNVSEKRLNLIKRDESNPSGGRTGGTEDNHRSANTAGWRVRDRGGPPGPGVEPGTSPLPVERSTN